MIAPAAPRAAPPIAESILELPVDRKIGTATEVESRKRREKREIFIVHVLKNNQISHATKVSINFSVWSHCIEQFYFGYTKSLQ